MGVEFLGTKYGGTGWGGRRRTRLFCLSKKQSITIGDDAILNDLLFELFWSLVGVADHA